MELPSNKTVMNVLERVSCTNYLDKTIFFCNIVCTSFQGCFKSFVEVFSIRFDCIDRFSFELPAN